MLQMTAKLIPTALSCDSHPRPQMGGDVSFTLLKPSIPFCPKDRQPKASGGELQSAEQAWEILIWI